MVLMGDTGSKFSKHVAEREFDRDFPDNTDPGPVCDRDIQGREDDKA